jgi:hypothetical protein
MCAHEVTRAHAAHSTSIAALCLSGSDNVWSAAGDGICVWQAVRIGTHGMSGYLRPAGAVEHQYYVIERGCVCMCVCA